MGNSLESLRAAISQIEGHGTTAAGNGIGLCHAMDRMLPAHGLARAAFHEILVADPGAAIGFCAVILGRARGPIVWIGPEPDIWPDGLRHYGLNPSQLLVVNADRSKDGLWAFEEILRSPGVAGAILALDGPRLDLIAGRRIQLAAEAGGGIGLVMLPDTDRMSPSAARSRWRLGMSSSPGVPGWDVHLLRSVGGRPGRWFVTWNYDLASLVISDDGLEDATHADRRA